MPENQLPAAGGCTRRAVFAGGAVLALAGCGAGSTSSSGSVTGPSATTGETIVATSEIPVGSGKILAAKQLVVTQPTAGQFEAFSVVCPHEGCAVSSLQGTTITCPCHGSQFNLTGAVIHGPAEKGLTPEPVKVEGGNVVKA